MAGWGSLANQCDFLTRRVDPRSYLGIEVSSMPEKTGHTLKHAAFFCVQRKSWKRSKQKNHILAQPHECTARGAFCPAPACSAEGLEGQLAGSLVTAFGTLLHSFQVQRRGGARLLDHPRETPYRYR